MFWKPLSSLAKDNSSTGKGSSGGNDSEVHNKKYSASN